MTVQEWSELRDQIASRLDTGNPTALLDELSRFVGTDLKPNNVEREIHAMRGELLIRCDRNTEAVEAFRQAVMFARPALYSKYVLELRLGDVSGEVEWYVAALRTALAHGHLACGAAMVALLERIRQDNLDSTARHLVVECVRMSWRATRLSGQPGHDLLDAARRVLRRECDDQ